jgi:hypothetical protein
VVFVDAVRSRLGWPAAMPSRRFPKPWSVESTPSGYRVGDANGIVLAHVYGEPERAIGQSDARLTSEEPCRNLQADRQASRARRAREGPQQGQKPAQAAAAPVQVGDDWRCGRGSCSRYTAATPGPKGTSISVPRSCFCPSECRCRSSSRSAGRSRAGLCYFQRIRCRRNRSRRCRTIRH